MYRWASNILTDLCAVRIEDEIMAVVMNRTQRKRAWASEAQFLRRDVIYERRLDGRGREERVMATMMEPVMLGAKSSVNLNEENFCNQWLIRPKAHCCWTMTEHWRPFVSIQPRYSRGPECADYCNKSRTKAAPGLLS